MDAVSILQVVSEDCRLSVKSVDKASVKQS